MAKGKVKKMDQAKSEQVEQVVEQPVEVKQPEQVADQDGEAVEQGGGEAGGEAVEDNCSTKEPEFLLAGLPVAEPKAGYERELAAQGAVIVSAGGVQVKMPAEAATALLRIREGLKEAGEAVEGRVVATNVDAIAWLLLRVAEELS